MESRLQLTSELLCSVLSVPGFDVTDHGDRPGRQQLIIRDSQRKRGVSQPPSKCCGSDPGYDDAARGNPIGLKGQKYAHEPIMGGNSLGIPVLEMQKLL